jgi:hypothetical protein
MHYIMCSFLHIVYNSIKLLKYMVSLDVQYLVKWTLSLFHFYRWENWDLDRFVACQSSYVSGDKPRRLVFCLHVPHLLLSESSPLLRDLGQGQTGWRSQWEVVADGYEVTTLLAVGIDGEMEKPFFLFLLSCFLDHALLARPFLPILSLSLSVLHLEWHSCSAPRMWPYWLSQLL